MRVQSFPLPNVKAQAIHKEIYSHGNNYIGLEELKKNYERKISSETSNIKNQYLYIEDELLQSFLYVQPISNNLRTSSVRFATIIREAANLYEIISKSIYRQLFDIQENDKINILNYLTLDVFLRLSRRILSSPILYGEFNGTEILQPYKSLVTWDKNSPIMDIHIPKWWTSYNKIKHDVNGFNDHATLENALLSVGALYIIIDSIYGEGVVGGVLKNPISESNTIQQLVPVSRLFIEETIMVTSFA